jgi:hypothetical protein
LKVLAYLLKLLGRLAKWLPQRNGKSSARLQITVSGMAETSSGSQGSINSNQEPGQRTDSNEHNERLIDLQRRGESDEDHRRKF